MKRQTDSNFLTELMTSASMGWWEADLKKERYVCSEYLSGLLGLDETGIIGFEEFNKRILKEEQRPTTVHSFEHAGLMPETVYLLDSTQGPVWIRSKVCFKKTGEDGGTKTYGVAEIQDGPDMASAYQALQRSERILHNIYKNLPVGIELYDKNGTLIDLNDKEIDIFHLKKKEDLLGINIFENPIFPEEMKEKLRKNEDADFSFRYDFSKIGNYYRTLKKEGTIDLMTKVTTLYDDDLNPVNYLLINADKTETTVAYNKIQEFESFFELVGDYSKVGYAHFNVFTGKGFAQKSWYRNLGEKDDTPLAGIIGVYAHLHPEDRREVTDFIEKVRKGMATKLSREVRVMREEGGYTWTHLNLLVKKYAPRKRTIELICINYDITELKETEAMLIKARDRAQESDRLKTAFLANMSHEIRTPLNAIVGFSGLLAHTDDKKEKEQYHQLISHNNNLLLNLVNDMMDLSKIESGHIEIHPCWFNLSELVEECAAEYRNVAAAGVKLLTRRPERDFLVELDQIHIKQILNNLVSNALKNTSQGYVEISYRPDGKRGIVIEVTDTGCGIPPDKTDKIFERFEKVNAFVQGAGVGLSICKSITGQMNGQIGVVSEVGSGSTFSVELPCRTMFVEI